MSFIKLVQSNKISRPNQRSFDLNAWRAEASKTIEDERSKNLHTAGAWFYTAFNELRKQLTFASDKTISKKNKLLALIAHANLNAMMYDFSVKEIVESASYSDPDEVLKAQISPKFYDGNGVEHSMDEVAQSDIDGLQLPIQIILCEKDTSSLTDTNNHFADIKRVELDYRLGAFYKVLEDHWEDCLWNDYRIDIGSKISFSPGNESIAKWKVITQYRRNVLIHSATTTRLSNFHQSYQKETHYGLGIPRPICSEIIEEGKVRYLLPREDRVDISSASIYLLMNEALEPYYIEFSKFQSPKLNGGLISDVVRCWAVLSSLARLLITLPESPSTTHLGDQPHAHLGAPKVDRKALIDAISESLNITSAYSEILIGFLTFDENKKSSEEKNELWTQPLINFSSDKLLILFTPLIWGTMRRNVNIWLRQMGADLSVRGYSFEIYLRETIFHHAQTSKIKHYLKLLKHALKFNLPTGAEIEHEDIDFLMLIGKTLLVGEIKCFLPPADSFETFKHREKTIDACGQLERKIKHIKQYDKSFRKQCLRRNLELPKNLKLMPLVLLNGPAHCGIPYNGIPIVDINILATFLKGTIRHTKTTTIGKQTIFEEQLHIYSDITEAEARLQNYLCNPPQLEYIKNSIALQESNKSNIAANIKEICYRYFDIKL